MKKQIIFLSIAILTVTTIFSQVDTAMRKIKTLTLNGNPPPYNPIPPVDFGKAPIDANFYEISLSNSGTINGKGIKNTGIKGCTNCNVAGKIMITPSGNTTRPSELTTEKMQRPYSIPDPRDTWFTISSSGLKTSIKIGPDGYWSANLPAGVYKLSVLRDGKESTIAENIIVK